VWRQQGGNVAAGRLHLRPAPASRELRMRGNGGDVVHRAGCDVGLLEQRDDIRTWKRTQTRFDHRFEIDAIRDTARVGRITWVVGQRRRLHDDGTKPAPFTIRLNREHDVAVGTGVRSVWYDH